MTLLSRKTSGLFFKFSRILFKLSIWFSRKISWYSLIFCCGFLKSSWWGLRVTDDPGTACTSSVSKSRTGSDWPWQQLFPILHQTSNELVGELTLTLCVVFETKYLSSYQIELRAPRLQRSTRYCWPKEIKSAFSFLRYLIFVYQRRNGGIFPIRITNFERREEERKER